MKNIFALFCMAFLTFNCLNAQEFSSNRNPVGLEYNLLFNADTRFTVSQTGTATLNLPKLFDGTLSSNYTSVAPSDGDPTVVLIEGLPDKHIQAGAWIGWTTRYWFPKRFKIEGYDEYNDANTWLLITDYSTQDYTGGNDFSVAVPYGSFTKLRFTFYEGTGSNGRMGLTEIYFIHPEATVPYEGLWSVGASGASGLWDTSGSNINYLTGNVGIGTTTIPTDYRLAVKGKIISEEVKVQLQSQWPDYVFAKDYKLPTLEQVKKHIAEKGHLMNIPSAKEVEANGIELGEMNRLLLEKIEENTLYILELEERIQKFERNYISKNQDKIN